MTNTTQTPSNPHTSELEALALVPVVLGGPSTRRSGDRRSRLPLLRRTHGSRVARGGAARLPSSENRVTVSR
ncbi:hypothetical protein [Ornithinimicrobium sp. LYQ103]|uniref:hypothetical protein n=1 Tax=Ornithinimicrobium sp. LYQ103 TaxID=3378796 RepID=UPI00385417CE